MRQRNGYERSTGKGWDKLVDPLVAMCEAEGVEIFQIKEKFGGLRFYTAHNASDALYAAIQEAETQSHYVCEECGEKGTHRSIHGWLKTYCTLHYTEAMNERAR